MNATHSAAYAAALQELIDAPLEGALDVLGGATFLPAVLPTDIGTVRALWSHPNPPIELLDSLFLSAQRTSTIPRRVADVVQLATLAVAMNRCDFKLPQTEQPAFHSFYDTALKYDWVAEDVKELLDDGLSAVTSAEYDSDLAKLLPPPSADTGPQKPTMQSTLAEMARGPAAPPKKTSHRLSRLIAGVLSGVAIGWAVVVLLGLMPQGGIEPAPRFQGWMEPSNGQTISGWAWDRDNPNQPVQLEIHDGVQKATVTADVLREELKLSGMGNGKHGFSYEIPLSRRDGKTYQVRISIAGAGVQLNDSPRAITYR